jgi:hypothetical protein
VPRAAGWSLAAGHAYRHDATGAKLTWSRRARQWFLVEFGPGRSWTVGLDPSYGPWAPPWVAAAAILAGSGR